MAWPVIRNVERQAGRMNEMMQKLDVDQAAFAALRSGKTYMDGRTRCLNCQSVRECLLWLDAKPASVATPDFCPNASLFETCKKL